MNDHHEVVVVGSGFGGIGMAIALNRAGRRNYLVLEGEGAVGGSWRENTYPGIACDVPSHLYCFSTHPWPTWSGFYAAGAEIRAYLHAVAEREIGARLRLNAPMTSARWDQAHGRWRLGVGHAVREELTADVLVLACGRLSEPVIPEVRGIETFPGPLFHSARWDHSLDLAGQRVAVIGTGASATQLVPEIARRGAAVTVFQRTPAWVVPRNAYTYTEADRDAFRDPVRLAARRQELYLEGEARFSSRSGDPEASTAARAVALAHLASQVSDRTLRAALTPDYAFGCKRVLLSDDYYPTLSSGKALLEPSALAQVEGSVLTAESGRRHEADVMVLATGFSSTRQPYAGLVHGEGESLAEHWSEGMTSFASTVVSGFPNLFVLNGPNASLGHNSAVLMIEEQAGYVVRTLERRRPGHALRLDPRAEAAYSKLIDAAATSTPWLRGGCRNWYVDERSGRLTLLWPGTVDAFHDLLSRADGSEFATTSDLDRTPPSSRRASTGRLP